LEAFLAAKRAAYGLPNMPVIIVQLSNAQKAAYPSAYVDVVKAAQAAVAAEPNNYLITTDDLSTQVGNFAHYTAASYDSIGARIARKVIEINPSVSPISPYLQKRGHRIVPQ
jgi:hypothetical protein